MERFFSNFICISLLKPKTFDFQRLCLKTLLRACANTVCGDLQALAIRGRGLGRKAPGKAADIVIYALVDPRSFGLHDVAVGPVASGGRPALKGLWVNGQPIVENDVLRGVDEGELRAEARGAVRRLMADSA